MDRPARLLSALLVGAAALAACGDDDLNQIANEPPVAEAGEPQEGFAGDLLAFDASGSSDPDGRVVGWAWDFGDGATTDGEVASHIYNEGGLYTVELTVWDDRGDTATDTVTVSISDNAGPVAVIDAEATAATGANIRFSGAESHDPDGSIATWSWEMGDGTTRSGSEVDYAYDAPGTYTVRLVVTDDDGAEAEAFHQVVIEQGPGSLSGTWQWFLEDESLRDLGGLCGTFQDSMLTIDVAAPSISIVENAGSVEVDYAGTLDGMSFEVMHSGLLSTQHIWGTFTSMTTFEGFYGIEVDLGSESCPDRPVSGVKVQ